MKKLKYPTINEIIIANKTALNLIKVKKADQYKLLGTHYQIQEIINKAKQKRGDIHAKASTLLKQPPPIP